MTSAPELFYCSAAVLHVGNDGTNRLQISEIICFLIFGLLALFLSFLATPLALAHLFLASRNLTSIEGNYSTMPNPFDRGSCTANFAEVFGSFGPDWFIPLTPARPRGDGVSFLRSDEPESLPHRQGNAETFADVEATWRQHYHVRLPRVAEKREHVGSFDLITSAVRVIGQGCNRKVMSF